MGLIALFFFGPLVELYVLIRVGAQIGAFSTILLCVLTAVIGGIIVRYQGLQLLWQARAQLAAGMPPMAATLHGAMLALAGVLLFVPGFVSDALGFLLLIPAVRRAIIARYFPEARWTEEEGRVVRVRFLDEE